MWKRLNKTTLSTLKPGDVVRHAIKRSPHVVTGNYGSRVTAVSSVDIINPIEWEILNEENKTNL